MTENLLQYIWQYRLYTTTSTLTTTEGEEIIVIHPGHLNTNAGPDFLEAKIKIGQTIWFGNVEIHILSSDWEKHKHETDANYDKLILHVVHEEDRVVKTLHKTHFPTLVLKPYLKNGFAETYARMMSDQDFIPCARLFFRAKKITVEMQLQRMLAERLEQRVQHIYDLLQRFKNDWQQVFYIQLARCFGLHINQDAFEKLALCTPLFLFAKYKYNPVQVEALLFGQAGFLFDYFDEEYPLLLQKEYRYIKKLYELDGMSKEQWKFLRLRPANFPTIRIAEFAQLVSHSTKLFSKIVAVKELKEIETLLTFSVSPYWQTHYTFGEKSSLRMKHAGKSFINLMIVNAILPTLFIYGKLNAREDICEKAIVFLQRIPAEKNRIISGWTSLGVEAANASDTQALLQQYNNYCIVKKCLNCGIGYEILKSG